MSFSSFLPFAMENLSTIGITVTCIVLHEPETIVQISFCIFWEKKALLQLVDFAWNGAKW
jgi:hypothetical protein